MIVPLTCLVALVALVASSPLVPAVPSPGPSGTLSWPGSGQTYNNVGHKDKHIDLRELSRDAR